MLNLPQHEDVTLASALQKGWGLFCGSNDLNYASTLKIPLTLRGIRRIFTL